MEHTQLKTACLDMEGVLIPELWPHLASRTKIMAFNVTTRDIPDYALLVEKRICLLREHGITLATLQSYIEDISELPGAINFVKQLSCFMNVVIVSDAFSEMIMPFHESLGKPLLQCHRFVCDSQGFITKAVYTRQHGKHEVIQSLKSSGSWVLAVGDAFNDLSMLRAADLGFLFRPSEKVAKVAGDIYQAINYGQIMKSCSKLGFID